MSIHGGRVTTFEWDSDEEIAKVEITGLPEHGNATVNPDNTIALVLSGTDYTGPLSVGLTVTYADGSTEDFSADFTVETPLQEKGWGQGEHYMLAEDEDGEVEVETGDLHRPVYLTEGSHGLTKADIAALEGLSEDDITQSWLMDHPEYGGSEATALATDVGLEVWDGLVRADKVNSHWLMFENGYTYEDVGRIIPRGVSGEDELHPIHITSWGEGERAELDSHIRLYQEESVNIVFSEVTLSGGFKAIDASNLLFDDVWITDDDFAVIKGAGVTVHDSEVVGVSKDAPMAETGEWHAHTDRSSGFYASKISGLLFENTLVHQNGWAPGYTGDPDDPQPPSMFSHNVYLAHTTDDVTFRDNIVSQGASYGLMARGGGFIEDNLFVDNNAGVNFLGGDHNNAGPVGNFTLFTDNVITHAAHKEATQIGAFALGVHDRGELSTLLDNIVAHIADPNDPDDIAAKEKGSAPLTIDKEAAYNDTIVYNWDGLRYLSNPDRAPRDENTEDLDESVLDRTTIQLYAEGLLGGDKATIDGLMDHIQSLAETDQDDTFKVDDIIAYFQNGFGIAPSGDGSETDHRFVPNDLGDGIRWDNRLNWMAEETPDDGDNVDLAGNWVEYGGTFEIGNLDLGSGGRLDVNSGKLTVEGDLEVGARGGTVTTKAAGQFWLDGYADSDRLTIEVEGGRFANTGDFSGEASINVSGGQALLGVDDASMVLGDGSELRIEGSDAKVGFDGSDGGNAIVQMADDAVLTFDADADGFSGIREFRSGYFDQQGTDVQSGLSLDGQLQIDLSGYTGGAGTQSLIHVDALTGVFDDIHVHGLSDLDARVVTDYETDEVRLELTEGAGAVSHHVIGDDGFGGDEASDLWAALTAGQGTYDDTGTGIFAEDDPLPELLGL